MTERGITRCAVIGHPVAHSLSPALHRAAYRALGLTNWQYEAIDVDVDQLAAFIRGLDDSWAGLSVTAPLKRACCDLVDRLDAVAAAVGAVNTVTFEPGTRAMVGANTDVAGIVGAVREGGLDTVTRGAIVGGGATAASAVAALVELGATAVTVHVRSRERAAAVAAVADRLAVAVEWASVDDIAHAGRTDLTISTVPLAGSAAVARRLAGVNQPNGMLLDVVYEAWPTPLASQWHGPVVSGHRMLVHQAVEQVRLMTGRSCPVAVLAAALPDDGDRRNHDEA